jgi:hypothetical protein
MKLNRFILALAAFAAVALASVAAASAGGLTAFATGDTYGDEAAPTSILGSLSVFRSDLDMTGQSTETKIPFLMFNLDPSNIGQSSWANVTVDSVTVCMYAETAFNPSTSESPGSFYSVSSSWSESTLTWNNMPATGSFIFGYTNRRWTTAGYQCQSFAGGSQSVMDNIIAAFGAANGVAFKYDPGVSQAIRWSSRENTNGSAQTSYVDVQYH